VLRGECRCETCRRSRGVIRSPDHSVRTSTRPPAAVPRMRTAALESPGVFGRPQPSSSGVFGVNGTFLPGLDVETTGHIVTLSRIGAPGIGQGHIRRGRQEADARRHRGLFDIHESSASARVRGAMGHPSGRERSNRAAEALPQPGRRAEWRRKTQR